MNVFIKKEYADSYYRSSGLPKGTNQGKVVFVLLITASENIKTRV
jgi:hypothetical protein